MAQHGVLVLKETKVKFSGGIGQHHQHWAETASAQACSHAVASLLHPHPHTRSLLLFPQGSVTWKIMYKTGTAGIVSSGPSALVEASSDCDGSDVWLFKDVAFDGVVKAAAADPYAHQAQAFRNGMKASSWQECCKKAQQAPETTVMERAYQYRARQYWTWNKADGTCTVKVRPWQVGATVLTMRRAEGVVGGMFGNEP